MERHANYALVGIVSTVFLIASIVFVVWLGGSQFRRGHDLYRIMFVGPVRGLSKGGEVQFNGIKVGQIQNIRLDEDDPNRRSEEHTSELQSLMRISYAVFCLKKKKKKTQKDNIYSCILHQKT